MCDGLKVCHHSGDIPKQAAQASATATPTFARQANRREYRTVNKPDPYHTTAGAEPDLKQTQDEAECDPQQTKAEAECDPQQTKAEAESETSCAVL